MWLARRGDLDGTAQILRTRTDAGDRYAAVWPAGLLAERGDLNGSARILRGQADVGDKYATVWLAALLAERDDPDRAQILHGQADAHDAVRMAGRSSRSQLV